jgi:4-hydroxy-2-oxoheptanedioate aldolase
VIPNRTKELIDDGGVAYGTFTTMREPAIVEMLGLAGYDFTIIDMEHSSIGLADAVNLARAAQATGLTPYVRVPRNDANTVLRVVESGIPGVLAPHINTAAEARLVVDAAKYWPEGDRGMDPGTRAARYEVTSWDEHMAAVNANTTVLILIEDKEALDQLDAICSVPGVDGGFIGPSDLARSFGVGGDIRHAKVVDAIRRTTEAYMAHGLKVGRAAFDEDEVGRAIEEGASLITTPIIDSYFLSRCFKDHLARVKR